MKSLAGAFSFYVNDNQEWWPGYWSGIRDNKYRNCPFYAQTRQPGNSNDCGNISPYLGCNHSGYIFSYYQDSYQKTLCQLACPKLTAAPADPASSDKHRVGITFTRNQNQDLYFGRVKSTKLRRPAGWCPIIEAENTAPAAQAWYRTNEENFPGLRLVNGAAYRHSGGATMIFGDFHVDLRKKYDIPANWSGGSPTYYNAFWNPWPSPGNESKWH
jgi:prepilin-type processing-associated H-X9-DG protein